MKKIIHIHIHTHTHTHTHIYIYIYKISSFKEKSAVSPCFFFLGFSRFSSLLPEGWFFLFFEKVVDKSTFICYNVQGKAENVPQKNTLYFCQTEQKTSKPPDIFTEDGTMKRKKETQLAFSTENYRLFSLYLSHLKKSVDTLEARFGERFFIFSCRKGFSIVALNNIMSTSSQRSSTAFACY